MKVLVLALTLCFASLSLFSCAHFHRFSGDIVDDASGLTPNQAPKEYRDAIDLLAAGSYDDAITALDRFIQQNSASPWSQAATFNTGRAYEGLKRWPDAINRYLQVVAMTNRSPKLQAMSLYRLSLCHEALGDDAQVVVDLNDLIRRSGGLPAEIAQGELPARLAGAYARIGNFERAQEFYRRAENGISQLRRRSRDTFPEWLPKTLFLMGESSNLKIAWSDYETALRPFARSQIYLLESAEINQTPWSGKAADELIRVYDSLMTAIEDAPVPDGDPAVARRTIQQKQWERASLLVDLMNEIRARTTPDASMGAAAIPEPQKRITTALQKIDKRIQNLLSIRPAGEGLTESAIARKKSKQKLQALTDDHSLEAEFLRSSREAKPGEALVPAPQLRTRTGMKLNESLEPIHSAPAPGPIETDDPNL